MHGSSNARGGRSAIRLLPFLIGLAAIAYFAIQGPPPGPVNNRPVERLPHRHGPRPDGTLFRPDRFPAPESAPESSPSEERSAQVPRKVMELLEYIDEHHHAPEGYEGGRRFLNLGRDGEQLLPREAGQGRPINYREWDINPKIPGRNRGPERMVTGSDGSAYYTADHYRTFTKVRRRNGR